MEELVRATFASLPLGALALTDQRVLFARADDADGSETVISAPLQEVAGCVEGRRVFWPHSGRKILLRPAESPINFDFVLFGGGGTESALLTNRISVAAERARAVAPVPPRASESSLHVVVDPTVSDLAAKTGGSLYIWTAPMFPSTFRVEATTAAPDPVRALANHGCVEGVQLFVSPELRWFNQIRLESFADHVRARAPGVVSGVRK